MRVRQLLEQLVPPVYRFSLRLTRGDAHAAEDLTQETMLRAWRHQEKLRDDAPTRAWLFKVTANLWRDELRRQRAKNRAAAGSSRPGPSRYGRPPDRDLSQREELAGALRALDELPARQRQVLYLSACEGLSVTRIAEVLQIEAGAVKASLSVARQRLRRRLQGLPAHSLSDPHEQADDASAQRRSKTAAG